MQTELKDILYFIMECLEYETYKIFDVALQNLIIHIHIAMIVKLRKMLYNRKQ